MKIQRWWGGVIGKFFQKIFIVTFIRIVFCSLPILDTKKPNIIAIDDMR
jgi:hypothetical protein